jgi:hypothetical protein
MSAAPLRVSASDGDPLAEAVALTKPRSTDQLTRCVGVDMRKVPFELG